MNAKTTIAILIILLLSGCSTLRVNEQSQFSEKVGRIPNIGEKASAPVGGVIYQQYRYISKTGYRLSDSLNARFKIGKIIVSAGDFLRKADIDGKTVYCTEKLAYYDLLAGPTSIVCFIDSKQSGTFDRITAAPGLIWLESELQTPVRYEKSEQITQRSDSFKYELIYEGVSNKSLRLAYREYNNDFARPAFFQSVSYDMASLPATITFRSVRIAVGSANNESIKYRILSGF